jgi:hypothetical protein
MWIMFKAIRSAVCKKDVLLNDLKITRALSLTPHHNYHSLITDSRLVGFIEQKLAWSNLD